MRTAARAACSGLLAGLVLVLAAAACGTDAPGRSAGHGTGGGGAAPPGPDRGGPTAAVAVTDDAGREVRLAAPAARVVSLVPAATEVVLALGAGDRLVARTDYDADPRVAHLPSVGGGLTPALEWLAARRPDLVVAWADAGSRAVGERLEALGVSVYAARVETLEDAAATVRRLGVLLGREARADSLNAAVRARIAAVRGAVQGLPRPRVLYAISLQPPMVAGPGSFVHQLLGAAGATNVFADAGARWAQVSFEEAVRRRPDVVVLALGGPAPPDAAALRAMPGWRELEAVRDGRVVVLDAGLFNRPGPRLGEAAERLALALHPEAAERIREAVRAARLEAGRPGGAPETRP